MKKRIFIYCLIGFFFLLAGCTNLNKTEQGLLTGGLGGAAVGAGIAAIAGGSAGTGALLGSGIGIIAGGIYGHSQEKGK